MAASTHLLYLEKVYKKLHSKKYHFVEQSLYKLEAEEAKMAKMGSIQCCQQSTDLIGSSISLSVSPINQIRDQISIKPIK